MKSFKSLFALMAFTILLFVSGSLQQNYVFSDASTVSSIPTSIAFDNNLSPDDASLSLCSELSSATSFVWYKIDATSSLRTISIDTCDVDFDSIIGVFSGADFASLISLGCNDDRATSSASCNPSSSALENISISSGETIYIVVGAFVDPYTSIPSLGSGHLQITVIDLSTLECTSDLILQVEQDLQLDLANTQSTITSAITSAKNQLQSDLSDTQTAITTAIDNSESNLSANIQGVQDTADSIETVVTSTATTVSSISSLLTTVDGKVDTVQSDINTIDASVTDVSGKISTLSSSMDTKFTNTNTNIDDLQTTADQIVLLSNQLLANSSDIETQQTNIASQLTSFETAVDSSFTALESDLVAVHDDLVNINTDLSNVDTHVNNIDDNVNTLGSNIDTLSSSVTTKFANTNTNIDDVQATADQIVILANQMLGNDSTVQTQNDNLVSQITAFNNDVDSSFSDVMSDIANIVDDLIAANSTSQSSFASIASQISGIQSTSNSIKSDSSSSLSILNNLQANVKSDSASNVFTNTIVRYLSDSSVTTPLSLRIPNTFGGRMDDVAAHVVAQYNTLKTAALAIGSKSSTPCTSNAFCNFFLNTADAAYSTAIVKYNSNARVNKFILAYSYLQQAFISLYPTTF